jgi:hypothetical protein
MTAVLALASSSFALEKRVVRNTVDPDGWSSAATCQSTYFNICTGWLWVWSGFPANERVGVTNDRCCTGDPTPVLAQTQQYQLTATPPGYGFTGTIAVHNADALRCPVGAPLASQPWISDGNDTSISIQVKNWNVVIPATFALVWTFGPASGNPTEIITEHPLAGPTGPVACGTCYPTSRVNHTFDWGSVSAPGCPGSTFADGSGCDAQICVFEFVDGCTIAVEPQTWGNIKNLYR